MKLSVVIPAYNEEKDIEKAVRDVSKKLPDAEIIVVNDASTDSTLSILRSLQILNLRILTNSENRGHGYSVVTGLKAATGDSILYIDADRQIEINNFFTIPEENLRIFDFISGYRVHRNDKLFRKVISFCLKMTNLIFHRMYIKDANCPFKIYKREALLPLLDKLPKTNIIPVACLEVLARKEDLFTGVIPTPHFPYQGVREGFLQVPDRKAWKFFVSAFFEIIKI